MPVLNLKIAPLQNPERYQALAGALTRLTAQILRKRVSDLRFVELPNSYHVATLDRDAPLIIEESRRFIS